MKKGVRKERKKRLVVISIIVVVILIIGLILLLNYFGVFNKISGKVTGNAVSISCTTNSNCPKGYVCNIQTHTCEDQIKLSLATLKDIYKKGEIIQLTDPPEEVEEVKSNPGVTGEVVDENIFNSPQMFSVSPFESIPSEGMIPQRVFDNGETSQAPSFKGYIIEFQQQPLVKKQVELTETSKRDKSLTLRKIKTELALQKQRINSEHTTFKQAFSRDKSLQQPKILGEYTKTFNGIALDVSDEEIERIKSLPGVKSVYPNYEVHTTLSDSVPLIQGGIPAGQLDINGNNCVQSGKECLTGKGVTIAIIDTGVDYTHPDLGGCTTEQFLAKQCSKVIGGYDFSGDDSIFDTLIIVPDNDPMDNDGHGTHVASIAAGNGVLKGVAPDAKIIAYKVFPYSFESIIISAIERSVDPNQDGDFSDHADIISMSLGGYGNPDDPQSQAVDTAVDAGVVVVVAAGNSGPNERTIGSPGTSRKAITVGASNKLNRIAEFSSRGPVIWEDNQGNEKGIVKPDIVAPGVYICAAGRFLIDRNGNNIFDRVKCLDNQHISISGTSMATPHVAGAVALIKQSHSDWTPEEIKAVLKGTAMNIGEQVIVQGAGRIDITSAVNLKNKPTIALLKEINYLPKGSFDIVGTVKGENFDYYRVYYSKIEEKNKNLICEGIQGGDNKVLCGGFDTTPLLNGEYYLILDIYKDGIIVSEDRNIFLIDKTLKGGWPYSSSETRTKFVGSMTPAIDDVEKDGIQDIIIHTLIREYVFNSDGNFKAGWPTSFHTPSYFTNGQIPSAAVMDIDNKGNKEIITTIRDYYGYNVLSDYSYCFNVYESNGEVKAGWPKGCNEDINIRDDGAYFTPIISDLNNDGKGELIGVSHSLSPYGGRPTKIQVFNSDGTYFMNWPYNFPGGDVHHGGAQLGSHQTISSADIDNDGKKEIIAIAYYKQEKKNYLFVLNYDGSLKPGYPLELPLTSQSVGGVILADIDNDGKKEIGLIDPYGNCYSNDGKLIWINLDGSVVNGYPVGFNDQFIAPALSVGDLDKDGKLETIFGTVGDCQGDFDKYSVYVFNYDGSIRNGWPKELEHETIWSQATVGDISGDGYPDVLISTNRGKVYAWSRNGDLIQGFPKKMVGSSRSGVAIGDIDGDKKVEIIASTDQGSIYVWDLDALYNPSTMDWPQFQHDAQHTGCYDCERYQSKITNNLNTNVPGIVTFKIEVFENNRWSKYHGERSRSSRVTIPAKGLVKLDIIFNKYKISINEVGKYRVVATFTDSSRKIKREAFWEFRVVE